ncbi:MAG: DEAD/DEAH box helicase [Planctomycetota bacterium]|jgi:ATP-dependent RNA helicase RhlE
MRFNELRLAEPIVCAVAAKGYTTPTPIQTKAIPEVLSGKDVLGCAQTGTGKTGAFALPILHRLANSAAEAGTRNRKGRRGRRPRALVLCPTRELATQIFESFCAYGRNLALRHTVVFGGVGQAGQVRDLRAGIDVLVATPGRLLDLIGQGYIDLGAIEVLVLDEADRMLDMGFIHDIRRVVDRLPSRRQTLLFSATMPAEIRRLADSILHKPVFVQAGPMASTVEAISQSVYLVARRHKPILLERLLRREAMERTLIFTRTKYGADKLVRTLGQSGIRAGAIHSNKSQNTRTRALNGFKSGGMPVLVATDIASRGIDVDDITHVVNFDIPNVPETYVHRIGRTARAGARGIALSFCDHEELDDIRAIERLIGMRLDVIENEADLVFDAPTTHRKQNGHHSSLSPAGGTPRRGRGRARAGRSRRSAASGAGGRPRRGGSNAVPAARQRRGRGVAIGNPKEMLLPRKAAAKRSVNTPDG